MTTNDEFFAQLIVPNGRNFILTFRNGERNIVNDLRDVEDYSSAIVSQFTFDNVYFNECIFDDIVLADCDIRNCVFINCSFKGALISNTSLYRTKFYKCELDGKVVKNNFINCFFSEITISDNIVLLSNTFLYPTGDISLLKNFATYYNIFNL